MGCFSSRKDESDMELNIKHTNTRLVIEYLKSGQYHETIIIQSTLYNYIYQRTCQKWVLRRKKDVFSIDYFHQHEETQQNQNVAYIEAAFQSRLNSNQFPIVLRPLRAKLQALPSPLESHSFITTIQKNDIFPPQIEGKLLGGTQVETFNFGNNGKYSFFLTINPGNNDSLKQFIRFHAMYSSKIVTMIKKVHTEFYGLYRSSANVSIQSMEEILKKKQIYDSTPILELNPNFIAQQYYTAYQIFNSVDDDGKLIRNADLLFIIDPSGRIVRSEKPDFYIPQRIVINQDLEDCTSSKSKCMNYEKKLLKELHALQINTSYKKIATVPIQLNSSELQKTIFQQHSVICKMDQISNVQYKDFKQLFMSKRLNQVLSQYHPGEPFQFELEKQKFYSVKKSESSQFQMTQCLYLLPCIYPCASPSKSKKVQEIQRELKESIGLKWKDPNYSIYSIKNTYSFDKVELMEQLNSLIESFNLQLTYFYLKKKREYLWNDEPQEDTQNYEEIKQYNEELNTKATDSKIISQSPTPIWHNKQTMQGFKYFDNYTLHNIPIQVKSMEEIIQIDQINSLLSCKLETVHKLQTTPIIKQLLMKFHQNGLNYTLQQYSQLIRLENIVNQNKEQVILNHGNCQSMVLIFLSNNQEDDQLRDMLIKYEADISEQSIKIILLSKYNQENIDHSVSLFGNCNNSEILFYLDDYKGRSFERAVVQKYFNSSPLNKIFCFSRNGQLQSSCNQNEFLGRLTNSGQIVEVTIKKQSNYDTIDDFVFHSLHMKEKKHDKQWDKIKQFIRSEREEIQCLLSEVKPSENGEQQSIRISSTKIMCWDDHNYEYLKYYDKANIQFQLSQPTTCQLENLIETLVDIL